MYIVNRGHAHFEPLPNGNKILAKQKQEQRGFLLARQLQEQEDSIYVQSLNPRCSMEEAKIERLSHQQQQILA